MKTKDIAKQIVGLGWFTNERLCEYCNLSKEQANSAMQVIKKSKKYNVEFCAKGRSKIKVLATNGAIARKKTPEVSLWRLAIFGEKL